MTVGTSRGDYDPMLAERAAWSTAKSSLGSNVGSFDAVDMNRDDQIDDAEFSKYMARLSDLRLAWTAPAQRRDHVRNA